MQRPVMAAFTPLPEAPETVATGNKLKGLVSTEVEPSLAEINAAKAAQNSGATGTIPASVTSGAAP